MPTAPAAPPGHGTCAYGHRASVRATAAITTHGSPPPQASATARPGPADAGERGRQAQHRRRSDERLGKQVGQHRDEADLAGQQHDDRRAGQLARPRAPRAQWRAQRGSRRSSRLCRGAASTSRPSVASTDNANPYDRASHGSATSSTTTAALSAGTARRRRGRAERQQTDAHPSPRPAAPTARVGPAPRSPLAGLRRPPAARAGPARAPGTGRAPARRPASCWCRSPRPGG